VKVGRGAFIKTIERARELASTMVALGTQHGVATVAQLTSMDQPLGRAVGNALEVLESVDVLQGRGPKDVRELAIGLAEIMLELVGIDVDPAAKLDDGSAYEVFRQMIKAQDGDPDAELPVAVHKDVVLASRDGVVQTVDALKVGVAAWRLGAGRARKEDSVSAGAGVMCLVREGDRIEVGQPLFELFADDEEHLTRGRDTIGDAVTVGDEPAAQERILLEKITK
jgi:thymidine phosphorylase